MRLCAAGSIDPRDRAYHKPLLLAVIAFRPYEFLAHLTGTEEYAMGFVASNLRIVRSQHMSSVESAV